MWDTKAVSPPIVSTRGGNTVRPAAGRFLFEWPSNHLGDHDLLRKPVPTPHRVRGRLFRDDALVCRSARAYNPVMR